MLATSHGVILFGGVDAKGKGLGDTWLWNGEVWKDLTAQAGVPINAKVVTVGYDPQRDAVVLFVGAREAGTWELSWPNEQ